MSKAQPIRRVSPGMTLVELLVVVTIAVVLVAAAVPMMKPALQSSRVREVSRQLNVFLQVARARAIETGRTAGIWIERDTPGSNASPTHCRTRGARPPSAR